MVGVLILLIGLTSGYCLGYFHSARADMPEVTEVSDLNPGISTIKFLKLENGLLKGEVIGRKARLAYSPENIQDIQIGDTFEIPIYQVTLGQYYTARDLPEGTQFIASKQGKYYYSVLDPKSFAITPKNRLYFGDETHAKNMGYLPSK